MESWYPDYVSFTATDFEIPEDAGTKKVIKVMTFSMGSGGQVKQYWNLLPNGSWKTSNSRWANHVAEAKRRGLSCGVGEKASDNISQLSKLEKAKSTCTDLGFTAGTEKHGDCVMRLIDL